MVAVRVSLQGTMPGGEKWSINPVYGPTTTETVTSAQCNTIVQAIVSNSFTSGITPLWSPTTQLTGVRVEARDQESGELMALAEAAYGGGIPGTGAGALPYQSAIVFSLRSNFVGASGRGRLYMPATGLALVPATLRASSTVLNTALTGVAGLLQEIEVDVKATLGASPLCVWSRTHFGLHAVKELRVGDVVDTQRRRRDALIESYLLKPYVGAP